ncbi:MAG: hypothetical protein ACOYJB_01980 [Christensenellaceae bacterium]|jgi:hypothetical protein
MKPAKLTVFVLSVLLALSVLVSCGTKDDIIKVGNDEIPSLYSVVGERSANGVSAGIEDGVAYHEKRYAFGEVSLEDAEAYIRVLLEDEGFARIMDTQENSTLVINKFARKSVDEGKIVVIDFQLDTAGQSILRYSVGEGTLELY